MSEFCFECKTDLDIPQGCGYCPYGTVFCLKCYHNHFWDYHLKDNCKGEKLTLIQTYQRDQEKGIGKEETNEWECDPLSGDFYYEEGEE